LSPEFQSAKRPDMAQQPASGPRSPRAFSRCLAISGVCDVVGAFVWFEVCERKADSLDEAFKRSRGGFSERGLQLGERLFDRIKIGAVDRQITQRRAGSLDRLSNAGDFVGWQIVHHDDVAPTQGRREKMFDIGEEARAVHRPVEDARRGDLIATQRADEGRRHPVAKRGGSDEAAPAGSAAIKPDHIRLGSGFINEHETFRVQIGLAGAPFLARLGDIGAVLLGGAQ
jgi:hypothetical protein